MQTSKLTHCSLLQSSPMQNRVLTSADVEIVGFKREPATPKKSQIRVRLPSVSTTTDHNGLINLYSAFGYRGFVLSSIVVLAATFHWVVCIHYTTPPRKPFQYLGRPFAWVFFVMAILFTLLAAWIFSQWKRIALEVVKMTRSGEQKAKMKNNAHQFGDSYRNNIGINGKYYLWKLYVYEIVEGCIQFNNLRQVFLCMMPLEYCWVVMLVMILESGGRAIAFGKRILLSSGGLITVNDRDQQVITDILMDLFFLVYPLAIIFQVHRIQIQPEEILLVILSPSISLFFKLRIMLVQTITLNMERVVIMLHERESDRRERKRLVIFGTDRGTKISERQNQHFPMWGRIIVFIISIGYCMLVLTTASIELIKYRNVHSNCKSMLAVDDKGLMTVWEHGCKVKTPFCKNMFLPSCESGCAVVEIKNHNLTALPANMVKMTNMKRFVVQRGPLEVLPQGMEKIKHLTEIDVRHNKLKVFNVDTSQYTFLSRLFLGFNNIKSIHESVFVHQKLTMLWVNSNKDLNFPPKIRLPHVYFLDFRNNSVNFPSSLGFEQTPMLRSLYLNGNFVGSNGELPQQFSQLSANLVDLGISGCNIKSLPSYFTSFRQMRYLDARDNRISSLPEEMTEWIKSLGMEAYFHNNTGLCDDANFEQYCAPLCSRYCFRRNHKNGHCDDACNSKECQYDGGECIVK